MVQDVARPMLPEDLDFDPSYSRQRLAARYLLGLAINALRGSRLVWEDKPDFKRLADQIQNAAEVNGILAFDEFHHAPLCRANHWHHAHLPTGPCTCGAARLEIR